jgi:hypothetical protein
MTPSSFFNFINIIAAVGWISIIVLSRFWRSTDKFVIGILVCLLAVSYSYLNIAHLGDVGSPAHFSSFFRVVDKIMINPWLMDAAWAHIVAFDLVIAILIKNNAAKHGINYGIVIIILLITIVFAPLGLLLYLLVRWIKTKQYFTALC